MLHNQKPHYKRWVQIAVLHHLNGIGDALKRNEFWLLYKMLCEFKIIDHTEDFKLSLRLQNIIGFSQALYNGYLRNVAKDLYRKYIIVETAFHNNHIYFHPLACQDITKRIIISFLCQRESEVDRVKPIFDNLA
jgi:hypothetical protein